MGPHIESEHVTKRLLQVLNGEPTWPPPIWLMRQAGRFLPEYRKLRAKANGFLNLVTRPELAAEITLQPVRRFGVDAAILFSDILIVPWALGQGLRYAEGEGPQLPPIRTEADLAVLDPRRLDGAITPILETVERVLGALDDPCTLIGFAGGPWTVACYMVQGGGVQDFPAVRRLAYENPGMLDRLLQSLTHATFEYLAAQASAGAEALMLFDTWAGLLPPRLFDRHVIEPTAAIVALLKRRFDGIRIIGFPRLAGFGLAAYAERTGVDAVGLDTTMDPSAVAAAIGPEIALQGNLDPYLLLAGGSRMRSAVRGIAGALRGRAHVFNLGHGVMPETPPEHVADLIRTVRDV